MKRILLALGLIACLLCGGGDLSAQSKAQSPKKKPKIGQLNKDLSKVRKKKAAVRKEIQKTRAAAVSVKKDIGEVDQRLGSLEEKLEDTTAKLSRDRREQKSLAQQLAEAEKRLGVVKQQVRKRLQAIYMQSQGTPLTALVTSKDMGEIASRKYLMETIAREDRRMFEEYIDLRQEVAQKKARQDQVVQQVRRLVNQQTVQQNLLTDTRYEKAQYLGQLRSREQDLKEILDQFERDEAAIESRIQVYLAAQRKVGGKPLPPMRGGFMRPVSGPFGSAFGMRFHPILRRTKLHTGQDFPANSGTPIRAAASGVVIASTYLRGYGNTVILDHGSGKSTVYAHCSRIYVRPGAKVAQGQVIAAVGSTGYSTGPHLHFEIRINGRPVNPRSYL